MIIISESLDSLTNDQKVELFNKLKARNDQRMKDAAQGIQTSGAAGVNYNKIANNIQANKDEISKLKRSCDEIRAKMTAAKNNSNSVEFRYLQFELSKNLDDIKKAETKIKFYSNSKGLKKKVLKKRSNRAKERLEKSAARHGVFFKDNEGLGLSRGKNDKLKEYVEKHKLANHRGEPAAVKFLRRNKWRVGAGALALGAGAYLWRKHKKEEEERQKNYDKYMNKAVNIDKNINKYVADNRNIPNKILHKV